MTKIDLVTNVNIQARHRQIVARESHAALPNVSGDRRKNVREFTSLGIPNIREEIPMFLQAIVSAILSKKLSICVLTRTVSETELFHCAEEQLETI
jgi:hypothetical protein